MKKYFLILFIPFAAFAETCEELKTQAISNITASESLLTDNSRYIQITYNNITALGYTLDTLDQRTSGDPYVNTARGQVSAILQGVQLVEQNENTISNYLSTTRSLLLSIDCSCDETETCPCDFSEIIQLLTSISSSTSDSYIELQTHGVYLSQLEQELSEINNLIQTGFEAITNNFNILNYNLSHNTTNLNAAIDRLYWWSQKKNSKTTSSALSIVSTSRSSDFYKPQDLGYLSAYWWQLDFIGQTQISLNNYLYNLLYKEMPILTNTVGSISKGVSFVTNELVSLHRDQTNYFSFFSGEIGVRGVLEDWQSEQVSGTYHDFLTNHYLTVVQGGPLSGNQSSKTNWFSRIETLLAALVFTDTTETNTVDSSVGESERSQISSAYMSANSAASSVSDDLKTTTQGIVELYRSYFETFDNAAMPSHVVLMRLQGTNGEEDVEIAFSSDTLGVLVEGCRIVTTLCWSSVGIFLLYKFLVWSARCVIVACQFIYRAISSVFKS